MRLPVLDIKKYSTVKQLEKMNEEFHEVVEAAQLDLIDTDKKDRIREALDLIQVLVGFIDNEIGIEKVDKYIAEHEGKLRNRKWNFKGYIYTDFKKN